MGGYKHSNSRLVLCLFCNSMLCTGARIDKIDVLFDAEHLGLPHEIVSYLLDVDWTADALKRLEADASGINSEALRKRRVRFLKIVNSMTVVFHYIN